MPQNMKEQAEKGSIKMMTLFKNIEKTHLRKLQRTKHKCVVKCTDDFARKDIIKSANCANQCSFPFIQAMTYIEGELERSQKSLEKCFQDCKDVIPDESGLITTEDTLTARITKLNNCGNNCLEKHCNMLPSLEKSIKDVLSNTFSS